VFAYLPIFEKGHFSESLE